MTFSYQQKVYVYHEQQQSALCARHCLNNLLQGPYFSEMDLSKIALQLDKEEQELLGPENSHLLKESHNVSMDGNFSVQVLRRALSNLGLQLLQLGSEKSRSLNVDTKPERQNAFICNLQAHWFAIRKINLVWYNLNSLSGLPETPAKPCVVTDFFLSAFLATLKNEGYSIYAVIGTFPQLHSFTDNQGFNSKSNWYDANFLTTRDKTYPKELLDQVNKSRMGQSIMSNNNNINNNNSNNNFEQQQLQRVLQESMLTHNNNNDNELQMALALSMEQNNKNNNNNNNNNNSNSNNNNSNNNKNILIDNDSLELKKAMLMSLQDDYCEKVKEEPDDSIDKSLKCLIKLQLPNGNKLERWYLKEYLLDDVINFVKSKQLLINNKLIFNARPFNFSDPNLKLDLICNKLSTNRIFFRVIAKKEDIEMNDKN